MSRRKYDGFRVCAIGNAIRWGTGIGRKESGVEGSRIFGKAVYVTLVHPAISEFHVGRRIR